MRSLLDQLSGGTLRTLGRTREVAQQVLADPSLFDELFDGIADDDEVIRGRAIMVVEEVTRDHHDWLAPYKDDFLQHIMGMKHWIVRSSVCKILPRFTNLTATERRRMFVWAETNLAAPSSVVKACALECLVRLTLETGPSNKFDQAYLHVQHSMDHGDTPALRARARKLHLLIKRAQRLN